MRFEWNEDKNQANYRKHGIWFEEAKTVWADAASEEFFDPEHSDHEDRFFVSVIPLQARCSWSSSANVTEVIRSESSVPGKRLRGRKSNMKKKYDLRKLKKRKDALKVDEAASKTPISIRLDGSVLGALKSEADRLGIPYQTFIGSLLHRYVHGELVDKKTIALAKHLRTA